MSGNAKTSRKTNKKPRQSKNDSHLNHGHRKRLRHRFINGRKSLFEYELLELILGLTIPHRDVKTLAKLLLQSYGQHLENVITDSGENLRSFRWGEKNAWLSHKTIFSLKVIGEITSRTSYYFFREKDEE